MKNQDVNQSFNQDLIDFIQASPTPFHATAEMQKRLQAAGFELLHEHEKWQLDPGKKYVLTRNDSSILAFSYGENTLAETGVRMVGAHTDSPCLRVKPNADLVRNGYWQVGVEVYGGVLLNPWFDRELSLAGKVSFLDESKTLQHKLINVETAIGMVPSLAIHLDREANKKRSINAQTDLPVLLSMLPPKIGSDAEAKPQFKDLVLRQLHKQYPEAKAAEVLDYELAFYDVQPGSVYGVNGDFIAASRLDNLLSCYVGLQSLLHASENSAQSCLLICNDHEEVGSASAAGAQGPMLQNFLQRLVPEQEDYLRCISQSMMISADNAHALHPNFADRHDANHGPKINAGPVLKINANQRYASNTETQSIYRALCAVNDIPLQSFVVRSDMACGSTIGPITATELGVKTLDIGVPTFAMHSIRETAGSDDAQYLYQSLNAFFALEKV
ncbi:MAG: M18 family aminopeptidase [Pseudomonadales bacterium]|nr:M18 family aminopeptidase [Pseudomonadales bacterium]